MEQPDPFTLKRPESRSDTKQFSDPNQPGRDLLFSFTALDNAQRNAAGSVADHYIGKYVGYKKPPTPAQQGFPAVGGKAVAMSETLCQTVCVFMAMQRAEGVLDEKPVKAMQYRFESWVALSVTYPVAWPQIVAWANGLNETAGEDEGNEFLEEPTDTLLVASSDNPADIQTLSFDLTGSSAPSTTGSPESQERTSDPSV